MLNVNDLTIEIGTRPVIKDFSFTVNPGDKVAIIGEEGNGKSTLLKALYSEDLVKDYANLKGNIDRCNKKLAYLPQFLDSKWHEYTVTEYLFKRKLESDINYDLFNRIGDYNKIFSILNLDESLYEQKMGTLSGGEKIKVQLSKIIFNGFDILLLDEPTNDLDIPTLIWFEDFIKDTDKAVIYITHDETLLENTANAIIHMEQIKKKSDARNTFKRVSFNEYLEERERAIEKDNQIAASQKKEYKEAKKILSHQKSSVRSKQERIQDSAVRRTLNKKMKNIKVQEKQLESRDYVEEPDVEDAIYSSFSEDINIHNSKLILDYHLDELKIGDKHLSNDINLLVKGPSKVVITGKNGTGKTTLLNDIYKKLKNNKDFKIGYMPQNYSEELNLNQTALKYLKEEAPDVTETVVRSYMGNMKFTADEMEARIKDLSGGQRAKILLLKMILSKCSVMILDEPTRNLSPLSNPVVRKMLKDYKGAIISVSHDRKYVNEVCDVRYELTGEGLIKKDSRIKVLK